MSTHPTNPRGLGEIIITARGFDEYCAIFGLSDADLVGRVILDCPGGAGSFATRARAVGATVTSVDPAYATPVDEFLARARRDTLHGNDYTRTHPEYYVWTWFQDADIHQARRLAALDAFIADYRGPDARYIPALLPDLPFPDRTFDLVLSAHLMFTYPDHFDRDASLAALRELVRVSRCEVRVFPLIDTTATPSTYLDDLRAALAADGVPSALRRVPYEFQRGAHTMLVLDTTDFQNPGSTPAESSLRSQ